MVGFHEGEMLSYRRRIAMRANCVPLTSPCQVHLCWSISQCMLFTSMKGLYAKTQLPLFCLEQTEGLEFKTGEGWAIGFGWFAQPIQLRTQELLSAFQLVSWPSSIQQVEVELSNRAHQNHRACRMATEQGEVQNYSFQEIAFQILKCSPKDNRVFRVLRSATIQIRWVWAPAERWGRKGEDCAWSTKK